MKLKELECNSCGATLKLDVDNLGAYCQFCGKKLLIDMDQLSDVIKEKEKTKQVKEKEEHQTKRKEMDYNYKKDKERFETKIYLLVMGGLLGIIIIGAILESMSDYIEYFYMGLGIAVGLTVIYYLIKFINKYGLIKKLLKKLNFIK